MTAGGGVKVTRTGEVTDEDALVQTCERKVALETRCTNTFIEFTYLRNVNKLMAYSSS